MKNSLRNPSNLVLNLFAYGGMGFMVMIMLEVNFWAYFLTDIVAIPAALAGTVLLIARLSDGIAAVVAGGIAERYSFKWGKYGSWLILAPPITIVLYALMFTDYTRIGLGIMPAAVLLVIFYALSHLTANIAWSSHYSLLPAVGHKQSVRARLSSKVGQAMSLGGVVFGLIAMPLVSFFGRGDEAKGYFWTSVALALVMMIGYYVVYKSAKPWIEDLTDEAKETPSFIDMWNAVKVNPHAITVFLAYAMFLANFYGFMGFGPYYFNYVAENPMLITPFYTLLPLGSYVGAWLSGVLFEKVEYFGSKKKLYFGGGLMGILSLILAYLLGRGNAWIFIACATLAGASRGIIVGQIQALFADTSEYSEWKIGKGAKGIIMGSVQAVAPKIGVALSGALIGYGLSAIGYEGGIEVTTGLANGIHALTTLLPIGLIVLSLIIMSFYRLTEDRVAEMRREMEV